MKILFFLLLLSLSMYAQQVKIDMHGGQESYSTKEKNDFRNSSLGVSTFLEGNATKRVKPTQK